MTGSVRNPSEEFRALAWEGQRVLGETARIGPARGVQELVADVGAQVAAGYLGLPRLRRPLREQWSASLQGGLAQRIQAQVDGWIQRVVSVAGRVSTLSGSLKRGGNSSRLVAKFGRAREAVNPRTRIQRTLRAIEAVTSTPLVYNDEIPVVLAQRKDAVRREREAALLDIHASAVLPKHQFASAKQLSAWLDAYPVERDVVLGAVQAFLGNGSDRWAQALASCRNALEGLGKRVTGSENWKDALRSRMDDATKKQFNAFFDFLSARGSHAGKRPTEAEARFGLQQTIAWLGWALDHAAAFVQRAT